MNVWLCVIKVSFFWVYGMMLFFEIWLVLIKVWGFCVFVEKKILKLVLWIICVYKVLFDEMVIDNFLFVWWEYLLIIFFNGVVKFVVMVKWMVFFVYV